MCQPQPIYKTLTIICNKINYRWEESYTGDTQEFIDLLTEIWEENDRLTWYRIEL